MPYVSCLLYTKRVMSTIYTTHLLKGLGGGERHFKDAMLCQKFGLAAIDIVDAGVLVDGGCCGRYCGGAV